MARRRSLDLLFLLANGSRRCPRLTAVASVWPPDRARNGHALRVANVGIPNHVRVAFNGGFRDRNQQKLTSNNIRPYERVATHLPPMSKRECSLLPPRHQHAFQACRLAFGVGRVRVVLTCASVRDVDGRARPPANETKTETRHDISNGTRSIVGQPRGWSVRRPASAAASTASACRPRPRPPT